MGDGSSWTCRACGRSFTCAERPHACFDPLVEEFLASRTPISVGLYRALERTLEDCGAFRRHVTDTRIAFVSRMSFCGATFAERWIDVGLILPWWVDDDRFARVEVFDADTWAHGLRLTSTTEIDDDLRAWTRLAYARGDQQPMAAPVNQQGVPAWRRRTADRLVCPWRGEVEVVRGVGRVTAVPAHVLAAIGDPITPLQLRVGGATFESSLAEVDGRWVVPLEGTGAASELKAGDQPKLAARLAMF